MHLMLNLHSSSNVIHVCLDDVRNHSKQKLKVAKTSNAFLVCFQHFDS